MIKRWYKSFLEWVLSPVFELRPEQCECTVVETRAPDPDNIWDPGEFTVVRRRN